MNGRAFRTWFALLLAGLWGLGLGIAHWQGGLQFLEPAEAALTDLRTLMHGRRIPPQAVTIVAIDDKTVGLTGTYPISREELARIVTAVARLGARAIAIDMLLVDAGPEASDRALAHALAASPSIIAAAAVYASDRQLAAAEDDDPLAGVPEAERILMPRQEFAAAAKLGIVNIVTGSTGTPRFFPMLFRSGGELHASLVLQAAAVALSEDPGFEPGRLILGGRVIPTDTGLLLPIDFYGPRNSITTVSAAAALGGDLDRSVIEGRVVVVGATVTGGGDVFHTPFDPVLPGVEVIATAITHLIAGDGPIRDRLTRGWDAGIATALPLVFVALLAWRHSAIGFGLILAVAAVWFGATAYAFSSGIWLSVALPLAAAIPPAVVFGLAQIWLGRRQTRLLEKQSAVLQKFQAPAVAEWLIGHPDFLAKPVRQRAAIVFVDLSGFTGLSENLGPHAVRELLKAFHDLMEEEVEASGGIIIDFTGDGAMIVFGLPAPKAEDAANAARCCVALARRLRRWLALQPAGIGTRLDFKMGAHVGDVVTSRLGGRTHQQIAATGDTVNLANRLMHVAALHGAALAVSNAMLESAGRGGALHKSGDLEGPIETDIRGRSGTLSIWLWRDPLRAESLESGDQSRRG
jgi:adenylate cyclase